MHIRYALQGSLVALTLVASTVSGCSDDSGTATSGSGGAKASGGASSGGTSASTGGKAATTGGSSSGGASAATGGKATGGSSATGGSATGGLSATGGATSGGSATGGSSATGGAASGGGAIGTGACTLPEADASAMGKTCMDYCEAWLGPGGSCHDMEGFKTTYVDDLDQSDCRMKCAAFTQSQFCCRMQHVLLSLAAIPANWETAQPAAFTEEIVHCGHAAGTTLCQN